LLRVDFLSFAMGIPSERLDVVRIFHAMSRAFTPLHETWIILFEFD